MKKTILILFLHLSLFSVSQKETEKPKEVEVFKAGRLVISANKELDFSKSKAAWVLTGSNYVRLTKTSTKIANIDWISGGNINASSWVKTLDKAKKVSQKTIVKRVSIFVTIGLFIYDFFSFRWLSREPETIKRLGRESKKQLE